MLEPFAEDVWIAARPLRFFGVEVGTRMTVVRLRDGGLFVHSPVALDLPTRHAIDALGPVTAIVAPTLFHHLYVAEWALAYPSASLSACPGLEKKRKDVAWSRVLGDGPEDEWNGALEQTFFGALPMQNEVVFFHRKTRTLISSDLIFNLASHSSGLTRAVAFLIGHRKPGPTLLERVMVKDRLAARDQIGRMVAWDAVRIVLAHGDVIASNGSAILREGYDRTSAVASSRRTNSGSPSACSTMCLATTRRSSTTTSQLGVSIQPSRATNMPCSSIKARFSTKRFAGSVSALGK